MSSFVINVPKSFAALIINIIAGVLVPGGIIPFGVAGDGGIHFQTAVIAELFGT